jgi:DNA-binding response OmpR family regulator/DNA-binding CsgD family transcriptional regulator
MAMSDSLLRHARILLVDDVPANLGALGEFLVAAGAKLFIAQSGEAALARLAAVQPDVVLLDVTMPGMDGFETCRRLRAQPEWADVPVLFITALGETADKVAGFAAGGADYIAKPFQAEEVLARVAAHLRIRALQRELAARAEELQRQNDALELEMQRRLATERAMQRSLDRAVLVATPAGEIQFCSDRAARLLARYLPGAAAERVPAALLRGERIEGLEVVHSARGDRDAVLWLFEERAAPPTPAMLESLGLTPREAEILFWIAHGKTNGEIGVILQLAPNTVKKHVQNLLPKLGVETRIAAALRAMEEIGLNSI